MTSENSFPKNWQVKKLNEVCEKISLNKIKIKQRDYLLSGIYPIVDQGQDLIGGYCNDESKVIPIQPPYIIFGDHTKVKKFINFNFIPGADGVKVLKPHTNINPKFFYYFLHVIKIPEKGYARHYQFIERESIPVPTLDEQQAIVSKLEALLSELDNGKQLLITAQEQLTIYRPSLLKWAFEGKLTNSDVKDGELPLGWKWVKIDDLKSKNKNALKAGPFGSSLKKEFFVSEGYKVYGQEQVISGDAFIGDYYVSADRYEKLNSNKIQAGDILISLVGTVGKVLILPENCQPGIINPRLIKLTLNKEVYLPKFFQYYFNSAYVRNMYRSKAQGTTMDVLNLSIIKTILFPLPSIDEQQRIVDELDSKLTFCDKIEETIKQALSQSESLRQSILQKAFEGKLI